MGSNPPLFLEVTVAIQDSEWSYIYIYIIAAAYRYNIDIFVHKVINNEVQIMKFPMDDECNHNKQFVFVKNYYDHFDFVRTYVRPCRCLKSVVRIPFEQNCITSNMSSEIVGVLRICRPK